MYLFFIREFNDIDHITPVVWKMKRNRYPIAVYCLNPEYNLLKDYRIQFLRQQGVKVAYIFDECGQALGFWHRIMRFISRSCFSMANRLNREDLNAFRALLDVLRRRARKMGKKYYKRARKKFYDASWASRILDNSGAKVLCFDHVNPDRYVVKIFIQAAGMKSIPTLALPHGVFIYTNNFVKDGSAEEDRYDKFNRFDHVVTQNELRKAVLTRAGVQGKKISVLGSARYCDEWMALNTSILPRAMKKKVANPDRLRAVFMTTRFAYRIDVDRMLKTFDLCSEFKGIEMVVKPHTRTGSEAKVYEKLPLPNVAGLSSVELCEWADIVLVIGSSILIEPLKQGKPVLYLKYLHENTTQYEEFGACWTIHDEAELKEALLSLQEDKTSVPYTNERVDRFLSEIINGGKDERDVLDDYKNFIVSSTVNRT
jgi:hypothetical protein